MSGEHNNIPDLLAYLEQDVDEDAELSNAECKILTHYIVSLEHETFDKADEIGRLNKQISDLLAEREASK